MNSKTPSDITDIPEGLDKKVSFSSEFILEFGNLLGKDPEDFRHSMQQKTVFGLIDEEYLAHLLLDAPRSTWEQVANMNTWYFRGALEEFSDDFALLCAYISNPDYTREDLLEEAEFPGILAYMAEKFPKSDTLTEKTQARSEHVIRI